MEILRHKNAAQCNSAPLTTDDVERVVTQAGRFIAWAKTALTV